MVIARHAPRSHESVCPIELDQFSRARSGLSFEVGLQPILPDHDVFGLEDEFPAFGTVSRYIWPAPHQAKNRMQALFCQFTFSLKLQEFNCVRSKTIFRFSLA